MKKKKNISWRYICKCLSLKSKSVCIAKCVCSADIWIKQYIFVIKVICLWILLNCLFISELAEDSCEQVNRSVHGSTWWCEAEVQVNRTPLQELRKHVCLEKLWTLSDCIQHGWQSFIKILWKLIKVYQMHLVDR